tara:strand:- start:32 stop:1852 length:1821 start_codon:yes stop_codon:yes gene_type:complete
MKDLLKIFKYVLRYYKYGILNIIFNVLTVIFSLFSLTMVIPFLGILFGTIENHEINDTTFSINPSSVKDYFYFQIQTIIDNGEKIDALLYICLLIIVMFFLRNFFRYLALYFLVPIRNNIVHDLRTDIHKKMVSLQVSFFTKKKKGDIISRMSTDLVEVEWSIMSSLEMIFRDPIQIILYIITLIFISPQLTLFVIILFPITGIIIGTIGKSLKKTSEKSQQKISDLISIIDENIRGLRVIKLLNAEKTVKNKFDKQSENYKKIMNSLLRRKDLASPLSEVLSTIVLVIIMWFGGKIVLDGNLLSPEMFIGYILIFSQIIPPARSLTTSYYRIQKGAAAAKRINNFLNEQCEITNCKNPTTINKLNEKIEFIDVNFKYDSSLIIKNINFEIKKGEIISIIGESGSGKTTIADLCARFYDVSNGQINFDNHNIKDLNISSLRNIMGVVSQESILFNDTIFNNILLSKPSATIEEVENAAKIANAHEFIIKLENKYETNIGERGDKLSGGEKQRISIARAVLKNPDVLILDEATSSLDIESESSVQNALTNLMKNRTTLIIAHKLSTIRNSDKIVVINNGEIIEIGTPESLMKNKDSYYSKLIEIDAD